MAILYEIERSGFADMLKSGLVITGGVAQTANISNFIHDLSGYKTRIGYPRHLFSFHECKGLSDSSAATSLGLLLAAKNSANLNCAIAEEIIETPTPEIIMTEEDTDDTPVMTDDTTTTPDKPNTNLFGEDEEELERLRKEEERRKKEEEKKKKDEEKRLKEEEAKKKKKKKDGEEKARIWEIFDNFFNEMNNNKV